MPAFTVSIPKELKERLDKNKQVNWPEYLKQRLSERLDEFKRFEELKNKGKLFER
jgi:hypothetical protein